MICTLPPVYKLSPMCGVYTMPCAVPECCTNNRASLWMRCRRTSVPCNLRRTTRPRGRTLASCMSRVANWTTPSLATRTLPRTQRVLLLHFSQSTNESTVIRDMSTIFCEFKLAKLPCNALGLKAVICTKTFTKLPFVLLPLITAVNMLTIVVIGLQSCLSVDLVSPLHHSTCYTFTPCVGSFTPPGSDRRDHWLLVPLPKDRPMWDE